MLGCIRSRKSRAEQRKFTPNQIQQPGTLIQEAHSSSSCKNHSCSSYLKRTHNTAEVNIVDPAKKRNKKYTVQPITQSQCCQFCFQIICEKSTKKWFVRSNNNSTNVHTGHLPIDTNHVETLVNNLSNTVQNYTDELLANKVDSYKITSLVAQRYNINVSYDTIRHHHHCLVLNKINAALTKPYGTPVDQLLADFDTCPDVSYLYVTHTIYSGLTQHNIM